MGRVIPKEKIDQMFLTHKLNPAAVGPNLGVLVVDGNVPVEAVAGLLCVSEPTIYRWMYGASEPRDQDKIKKVKALLMVLRKAKRNKDLPLEGTIKERVSLMVRLVKEYPPARQEA